jgi:hypothetical protein
MRLPGVPFCSGGTLFLIYGRDGRREKEMARRETSATGRKQFDPFRMRTSYAERIQFAPQWQAAAGDF